MTTDDRTLTDALRQVLGDERYEQAARMSANQPRDTYEDEETLRRTFGGLSKSARSAQRRPVAIKVDEYGYDRRGRYWAGYDGAAS